MQASGADAGPRRRRNVRHDATRWRQRRSRQMSSAHRHSDQARRSRRQVLSKLHQTGPARLCRWSGLVVSFRNSTTRTRPDQTHGPLGSPTSPRTLSGRRFVRSISTHVRTLYVGLVWWGRRQSPWVCVVEFGTDFVPCRVGPDQTKSADLSDTRADPTDGFCRRPWSRTRVSDKI